PWEECWRRSLAALEPCCRISNVTHPEHLAIDPGARLVAWSSDGHGLRVADCDTGLTLYVDRRAAVSGLAVTANHVFALDGLRGGISRISRDGRLEGTAFWPLIESRRLLGASPTGDRVLLRDEFRGGVYTWPGLD